MLMLLVHVPVLDVVAGVGYPVCVDVIIGIGVRVVVTRHAVSCVRIRVATAVRYDTCYVVYILVNRVIAIVDLRVVVGSDIHTYAHVDVVVVGYVYCCRGYAVDVGVRVVAGIAIVVVCVGVPVCVVGVDVFGHR